MPTLPESKTECAILPVRKVKDERDGHLDALRGAGILLVVFGHLIEQPSQQSPTLQALYIGIYSFHMPLFVFLSGIFAREALRGDDYRKIVRALFVPLVLFQFVYIAMSKLTGWYQYSLLTPYWLLWFIASLICWRLLLPLFASPAGLAVAVAAAVAAGYDDNIGYALSASRTLYFLPFFVLGHLYGNPLVSMVRNRRILFSCLFLVAMAAILMWWQHGLNGAALTGSRDYASGAADIAYPATGRMLIMGLGLLAMLGFCALVPRRAPALAWIGERSLSVYLLHGLAVMGFVGWGLVNAIPVLWLPPVLAVLTALLAMATAAADSPMRRVFSPAPSATGG